MIKVEPPWGEHARHFGPRYRGESHFFVNNNVNKKCITLNLKNPRGKQLFTELVEKSDVLLENYAPGSLEKMGFGYDHASKINPLLIYASSTGFGYSGPYRQLPAQDVTVQALAGFLSITGTHDSGPLRCAPPIVDYGAGLFTAIAILAALRHRDKTGQGQRIDVAMYDVAVVFLAEFLALCICDGVVPGRQGNAHFLGAPFNTYKTKDGLIYIVAMFDANWKRLAHAMGRENLVQNPEFATASDRIRNMEGLDHVISQWTSQKSTEEIFRILTEADVPCAPVRNIGSLLSDHQVKEREMIKTLKHPTVGDVEVVGSPLKFSATPVRLEHAGPPLGYHNKDVYCGLLGLSEKEYSNLQRDGVI